MDVSSTIAGGTAIYTVTAGDTNRPLDAIPISVIWTDLAGNTSAPYTTVTGGTPGVNGGLPTPVGQYLFGGDLTDSSGNGHDGTSLGGTSYVSDREAAASSALSVVTTSGDYSGANSSLGTSYAFTVSDSFTISLWFYASTYGDSDYPTLIKQWATANSVFQYYITFNKGAGTIQTQVGPHNMVSFGPTKSFTLNTWHHVALVYDRTVTTVTGYLDGSFFGTVDASYAYSGSPSEGPLVLGGDSYEGNLDDVRIYAIALSAAQISALYNHYP
jgi:hypothetical protein